MEIKITGEMIRVSVPAEMKTEAPRLLQEIWRPEFAHRSYFILEITGSVKAFVEKAKCHPEILVYV